MKPLEWDRLSLSQKLLIYGRTRQPILEQGAVFCDGTKMYRIPPEPQPNESVTIRLRTKKKIMWMRLILSTVKHGSRCTLIHQTIFLIITKVLSCCKINMLPITLNCIQVYLPASTINKVSLENLMITFIFV